jgi:hypothetical protein
MFVDRIPHEPQDVGDQGRVDAETLPDLGDAHLPPADVVEERRLPVDELHHVLVGRDDDRLEVVGGGPRGQRADDVVGLDPAFPRSREAERRDQLPDVRDLRPEVVRIGDRVSLYWAYIVSRNVSPGASNTHAM